MRRLAPIALALLGLSLPAQARPVDRERATKIAHQFLEAIRPSGARSLTQLQLEEQAHFYIYNNKVDRGGFVLISKEDSEGAVLGYSPSGSFVLDSLPEGLRQLFLAYEAPSASSGASEARRLDYPQPEKTPIPILMKSRWGQVGYAYNTLTPLSGGQHTPSGCVAVAMAQIMYYHRWPQQGKGQHTHANAQSGIGTVDFSQHTYAWEQMLPIYGHSELYDRRGMPYPPEAPRFTSVSQLMYDAGVAVDMRYTASYSGSFTELVPRAMREHFDYEASEILSSRRLGRDGLDRYVEEELRAGFPLYISGGNGSGLGHAWVVDGMDSRGFFHMNFGWEGQSDGYYSLRAINPSQLGSEFTGRTRPAFTANLQLIALRPKKAQSLPLNPQHELLQPRLRANLASYIRLVEQRQGGLLVEMSDVLNETGRAFAGDYGYGLYDEAGTLLRIYPSKYHPNGGYRSLPPNATISIPEQDLLPLAGLTEGTYELRLLSSELQEGKAWAPWHLMHETPTLAFQLKAGKATILEEHGIGRGVQPMAQPHYGYLVAGKQAQIGILLKNLTGNTPDLTLSLHLLDATGQRISSTTVASPVSFEARGNQLVYFQLSIPEALPAGRYRVELEAKQRATTVPVQRYRLSEDLSIEVYAPRPESLEVLYVQALANPEKPLAPYTLLDLQKAPELRLRIHWVRPATTTTPLDEVRISLVDVQEGKRILCGVSSIADLARSAQPAQLLTTSFKGYVADQLTSGRVYRLAVEGVDKGKRYDLWPLGLEQAYLSFLGATEPEAPASPKVIQALDPKKQEETPNPTPTDDVASGAPELRYFSGEGRLQIAGTDLRLVEVFSLDGKRILSLPAGSLSSTELLLDSLPAGIYLVRITYGAGTKTIRLAR